VQKTFCTQSGFALVCFFAIAGIQKAETEDREREPEHAHRPARMPARAFKDCHQWVCTTQPKQTPLWAF
jgi:hypothetical protein